MEFNKDHDDFLHHWQTLHFKNTAEGQSAFQSADVVRQLLGQLHYARSASVVSPAFASRLSDIYADKYSKLVDSPDPEGLNNYADGALTLCLGRKNESAQWTSSFSPNSIDKLDCVKKFQQNCKARHEKEFPRNTDNVPILFNKKNSRSESTRESEEPLAPRQNFHQESIKQPVKTGFYQGNLPGTSTGNHGTTATINKQPLFHPGSRTENLSKTTNRGFPENPGVRSGTGETGFYRSSHQTHNGAEHRVLSSEALHEKPHRPGYLQMPKHDSKRGFHDIDPVEQGPGPSAVAPPRAFRTAREQMLIDKKKKFGQNKCRGPSSPDVNSYGTAKKSLGTRRGPNSRFVPPVLNKDEHGGDMDDGLIRRIGPGKGHQEDPEDEEDERLKGIDPKMIELITNEIMDTSLPLSWDDIAGLEFAKNTIKEIVIWPMLRPDIFTGLRGPPKGLLLFGPPGTGKTLIGKCIASQSKSTFFSISASSLTSKWIGEGEKMVRALFAVARCNQPAVVFIDEIDSLLTQRVDGEHEASRRIKTEFLVQLDGAGTISEDRILVVGATNRPQEIDEAARRRFVKRLYIPLPEAAARGQIIQNLLKEQSYHLTADQLTTITLKTDGYSGADVANLCREAALGPIRSIALDDIEKITADQVRPISFKDFEDALQHVRASVSADDLDAYIKWNNTYGSGSR